MRRCEDEKMWRWEDVKWEDVKMRRCEDEKMWRWEDVKMSRCEDEQMWRWADVKMNRCEDEQMWRWEDVKMRSCEDEKVWKGEDVKTRRCEGEKMWRWEDERKTPTIGRTLRSDALGKTCVWKSCAWKGGLWQNCVCVTPLCFLFPPCPSHVHSCFVFLENVKFVGLSAPLIEIFNLLFLILLFYLALLWHFFWPTRAQL